MIAFHNFSFIYYIVSNHGEKPNKMRLYKAEVLVKKVKTCYNGVNGGVMALKKASLACTVCGSRNYSIKLSATPKPKRLEVNKFCKHCSKYTIHKETR
jgi:ribosomal protein L33